MDLFDLSGRVAIVTGGNGGIGLGIARALARAGASVAIAGRNEAKSASAVESLRADLRGDAQADAWPLDVADDSAAPALVGSVVERFGRLDILVNNAGTTIRKPPEELEPAEWRLVLDTNLTGPFLMARAAYPHFRAAGGGKVINIASINAIFGSPYATAYAASKGGLVQLTRSLALSWAQANVQVNAILPGWFDTEMTQAARAQVPGLDERVRARVPIGRWAVPDDLAGTAVWLASRASDFVTGTAIPVDGGFSVAP